MEEPRKQYMADMGKQKVSLCSVFSERVTEVAVQVEKTWLEVLERHRAPEKGEQKGPSPETEQGSGSFLRRKEGKKPYQRAVSSEKS